jgi:protein tyrosine/serine phosphatase
MAKKQSFLKRKYVNAQKSWADGIKTPQQRRFAKFDARFGDHSFLRVFWTNLHQLDTMVWRSNQPSPRQIRAHAKRGIKTIVNLRGPSRWGSYVLEKETCEQVGIQFINHRMYSRRMPSYEELLKTEALFKTINQPTLFHCKSGADRAGICSVLYMLMVKEQPIEVAIKQLNIRYLHIKHSKTGRLDHFLESYQAFNAKQPIPFMEWARDHYDREKLTTEFHSNKWYDFFVDKVLNRE